MKAMIAGGVTVLIVMVALQYIVKASGMEVSNLVLGAIAGMAGAFVLGQIHNKDKDEK
jgi:high-affinity Fe2+/Pb2+ permease